MQPVRLIRHQSEMSHPGHVPRVASGQPGAEQPRRRRVRNVEGVQTGLVVGGQHKFAGHRDRDGLPLADDFVAAQHRRGVRVAQVDHDESDEAVGDIDAVAVDEDVPDLVGEGECAARGRIVRDGQIDHPERVGARQHGQRRICVHDGDRSRDRGQQIDRGSLRQDRGGERGQQTHHQRSGPDRTAGVGHGSREGGCIRCHVPAIRPRTPVDGQTYSRRRATVRPSTGKHPPVDGPPYAHRRANTLPSTGHRTPVNGQAHSR